MSHSSLNRWLDWINKVACFYLHIFPIRRGWVSVEVLKALQLNPSWIVINKKLLRQMKLDQSRLHSSKLYVSSLTQFISPTKKNIAKFDFPIWKVYFLRSFAQSDFFCFARWFSMWIITRIESWRKAKKLFPFDFSSDWMLKKKFLSFFLSPGTKKLLRTEDFFSDKWIYFCLPSADEGKSFLEE